MRFIGNRIEWSLKVDLTTSRAKKRKKERNGAEVDARKEKSEN